MTRKCAAFQRHLPQLRCFSLIVGRATRPGQDVNYRYSHYGTHVVLPLGFVATSISVRHGVTVRHGVRPQPWWNSALCYWESFKEGNSRNQLASLRLCHEQQRRLAVSLGTSRSAGSPQ